MKVVNRICQVLAIVFGLSALVFFFTKFATVVSDGNAIDLIGAQLGFGSEIEIADGNTADMAKSAHILFCFLLTAVGLLMSIFSFKSKGLRYAAPSVTIISGVYMLVIALGDAAKFVDWRPLTGVTSVDYSIFVLLTAIALLVAAGFGFAYLLIDDYIEVAESKGAKRTILKRLVHTLRDYKSEIKKIVWPGSKDVLKNTVIVLIMCLIIGAFIWLLDFGLGQLLELILGE